PCEPQRLKRYRGCGWLRKSLTVRTSRFSSDGPNSPSQKPGVLLDDAGLGSETNNCDGSNTDLVFAQPRLADWFISAIRPCDFLRIRGGSPPQGSDGICHCIGLYHFDPELVVGGPPQQSPAANPRT